MTVMANEAQSRDGMVAQVLVEVGKLGNQVAIIDTKLTVLPDHEARLRDLERRPSLRWPVIVGYLTTITPFYVLVIDLIMHR